MRSFCCNAASPPPPPPPSVGTRRGRGEVTTEPKVGDGLEGRKDPAENKPKPASDVQEAFTAAGGAAAVAGVVGLEDDDGDGNKEGDDVAVGPVT